MNLLEQAGSRTHKDSRGCRKQAENLKRQIIGSARLASRNQELLTIENAVNKAFEEAKKKLQASSGTGDSYKDLLKQMVEESVSAIGGSNTVIIESNKNDAEIVRKVASELRDTGKMQQPSRSV